MKTTVFLNLFCNKRKDAKIRRNSAKVGLVVRKLCQDINQKDGRGD